MKKILFPLIIILSLSVTLFPQHSIKFGVGTQYLPTLSQVHYPFRQEGGFAGLLSAEAEVYFSKVGFSVEADISTLSTSSFGMSLKLANTGWRRTREYSFNVCISSLNKDGNSILLLGVGTDIRLSSLISGVNVLKNIDVEARILLPFKMFTKSELVKDVTMKVSLLYRLDL